VRQVFGETMERLVDAQQSLIEWMATSGLTASQAVAAMCLVATSATRSLGRSHDELVALVESLRCLRGKGRPYPVDMPSEMTRKGSE